ncbi:ARM repeat-containing protein [Dentipellis sp. KUC8613]|nr:ARM repeat-containing protein [Dentipellis sp. KUC8613]
MGILVSFIDRVIHAVVLSAPEPPPSLPPSSPLRDPSPSPPPQRAPSPSPPPDPRPDPPDLHIDIPAPPLEPAPPTDILSPDTLDLCFDDEGLSTLEKIYLFSRSQASFHKVYIAHAMPSILPQVTPLEAVEYVLPLLSGLAMDDDDTVKEALATELVPIIWWFTSNCRVTDDETEDPMQDPPPLLVQAFTPILGTLLLSTSPPVGAAARSAVVDILRRVREAIPLSPDPPLFGYDQRQLLEHEILQQVVIGIGRLDIPDEACDLVDRPDSPMLTELDEPADQDMSSPTRAPPPPPSTSASSSARASPPPDLLPPSRTDSHISSSSSSAPSSFTSSLSSTPDLASPDFLSPDEPCMSPPTPPSPIVTPLPPFPEAPAKPSEYPLTQEYAPSVVSNNMTMTDDWIPASPQPPHAILPEPESDDTCPPDASSVQASPPLDLAPSSSSMTVPSATVGDASPDVSVGGSSDTMPMDFGHQSNDAEADAGEQAALGRLSSMCLVAAVSASTGDYLSDETKCTFVREVGRIGRDPMYWVRKEASFALGALAKVVPVEVLLISLLPLFESLCTDLTWQVRHSALFALPAILGRLPPSQRRSLALNTIMPLSRDDSPSVRIRVLESLGEVIYTFMEDPGGPPSELLSLFLGRNHQTEVSTPQPINWLGRSPFNTDEPIEIRNTPEEEDRSFFDEPARPLICAFNYPAVALTLGRDRWAELRPLYVRLAESPAMKVRKTLAASTGEIARIVGPTHAITDVLPIWRGGIHAGENEVRMKALEAMPVLMLALPESNQLEMVRVLEDRWNEGLGGWREREAAAKTFELLTGILKTDEEAMTVLCRLLGKALQDEVAAVRVAGIAALPAVFGTLAERNRLRQQLNVDICFLSKSTVFRRRMTFVACYQALAVSDQADALDLFADPFWPCLAELSVDPVVDVRIGVARLIGLLSDQSFRYSERVPAGIRDILDTLRADVSHEVKSYVPLPASVEGKVAPRSSVVDPAQPSFVFATFSCPPSSTLILPMASSDAPSGLSPSINHVEQQPGPL